MKKTLLENRRGKKKARKIEVRDVAPYRYLIVCEGEETEPNYFQGIKDKINIKYRDKIDIIDKVELNISKEINGLRSTATIYFHIPQGFCRGSSDRGCYL